MKYDRLSKAAKAKARDWLREQVFTDSSDWENVYSDAVEIGALMGINIDNRCVKTIKGVAFDEPDIQFSGFWSQGDGCSYSAQLQVEKLAGCVERVKEHAPEDTELHAIAMRGEEIYELIAGYHMMIRLGDEVDGDDYPDCCPTMGIVIVNSAKGYNTLMADDSRCPPEISVAVNDLINGFAGWIYKQLEAEHNHQTDNDTLEENIRNNGYDFDRYGIVK